MAAIGRVCLRDQFERCNRLKEKLGMMSHDMLAKRLLDAWFESSPIKEVTGIPADNMEEDEWLSVGSNSRGGASQHTIATRPSQDSVSVTFSLDDSAESTHCANSVDDHEYEPSEEDESEEDDISSCGSTETLEDLYVPGLITDADPDIPVVGVSEQVYGAAVDDMEHQGLTPTILRDTSPQQAVDDPKSVVFESCLLDLAAQVTSNIGKCTSCYSDLQVQTHYVGSAVYLKWIIDKRETDLKSPNMEKVGLQRALINLLGNGIIVKELVTDGHLQIAHMMKTSYPEIKHSLDVWHAAKNFFKKITAVAAERKNKNLKPWIPDIINHFWFSSKTCMGSVDVLRTKMRGIIHHVVGEHSWISGDGVSVAGCEHQPIIGEHKPWLLPDSDAHQALRSLIFDIRWQNKLHHFTNFRYPVYRARNLLAAIDFDAHKDRPQILGKDGKPQYNRIFQKKTKNWSIFDVKEKKSYSYIPELLANMITHYCASNSSLKSSSVLPIDDPRKISSTIACKRPPLTEFLVDNKKSRF